jgi:hypothetical protein
MWKNNNIITWKKIGMHVGALLFQCDDDDITNCGQKNYCCRRVMGLLSSAREGGLLMLALFSLFFGEKV